MSLFAVILRVDSQIVRVLEVIFLKSLIGAIMQDSGKRERRAGHVPLHYQIIKEKKSQKKKILN